MSGFDESDYGELQGAGQPGWVLRCSINVSTRSHSALYSQFHTFHCCWKGSEYILKLFGLPCDEFGHLHKAKEGWPG